MDFLLEEVDKKEQERVEMEAKLEEMLEYEKMVEQMAQECVDKDREMEEMLQKIIELEEVNAIAEELNENQENYVKELNDEIGEKETEIYNAEQNYKQLEELVLDQEE